MKNNENYIFMCAGYYCLLKYMPSYLSVTLWVLFKSMQLFWKVIMHNDVTGCVTFISNKIEYLKK